MAETTDHRTPPKSGAGTEFERGVGSTPFKTTGNQNAKQDSNLMWVVLIAALVVAVGGYYYYTSTYAPSVVAPVITETVVPPVDAAPEATTPPVIAPETTTPPAVTPDPTLAPKTTP